MANCSGECTMVVWFGTWKHGCPAPSCACPLSSSGPGARIPHGPGSGYTSHGWVLSHCCSLIKPSGFIRLLNPKEQFFFYLLITHIFFFTLYLNNAMFLYQSSQLFSHFFSFFFTCFRRLENTCQDPQRYVEGLSVTFPHDTLLCNYIVLTFSFKGCIILCAFSLYWKKKLWKGNKNLHYLG